MGKVTLRDANSSADPAGSRASGQGSQSGAEERRLPFVPRSGQRPMWQWTLAVAPQGVEDRPRRPLSRCVWLLRGADGSGNAWPKIRGALGGTKMVGVWMLVPGGLFRARI